VAYTDDIIALNADHLYTFDGNQNDSIGTANGSATNVSYASAAIALDATNCLSTTAVGSRVSLPTTTTINGQQSRKAVCGWFETDSIQPPPKRLYGEGTDGVSTPLYQIVLAYGNSLLFECIDTGFTVQVAGTNIASPNRTYHFCTTFEGSGNNNEIRFYIDGVRQDIEIPDPPAPGTANITARGAGEFGDPGGASGIGGGAVTMNAPVNGRFNHWAFFTGANASLTETQIRQTLFERGAIADFTVSTNTQANMQTALDAITDSQGDSPCCIEIEPVSGGGDFTLTSDKIFNKLASIHFRYNGTADTLTVVNVLGNQQGDASIGSAPFGGSLVLATRQTLTVTVQDISTGAAISGARVYIKADTGGDLAAGTEIMNTTTNGSGVATATFDFTNNQPIIGYVRKGSSSTYYKQSSIGGPLTSTPLNETILMVRDE
jgi:hypothetical protein